MAKLVLLRHGQSMVNSGKLVDDEHQNILTHKGINQSVNAGLSFRKDHPNLHFQHVFCSPLHRAMQTGLNFLSVFENEPVHFQIVPEFIERRFGLDGCLTLKQMDAIYGEEVVRSWETDLNAVAGDHRGESLQQMWDRVIPAYEQKIQPLLDAGDDVLIVSHYYVMKVLKSYLDHGVPDLCYSYSPLNCVPYIFEFK